MTEVDAAPVTTPRPAGVTTPRVDVLGVRHHGPGSARAVVAALDELQPSVVLIEGPADADPLTVHVPALEPPVALLGTVDDDPAQASFWPFAAFSPEWQALRWAAAHDVPVRFIDLPAGTVAALAAARRAAAEEARDEAAHAHDGAAADALDRDAADPASPDVDARDVVDPLHPAAVRDDPLGALAAAAGHDDAERWWEDVVEQRAGGLETFAAVAEAMTELRASALDGLPPDEHEELREAFMRQQVRAALREGNERVAVVCGAWHAPALTLPLPPAAPDARRLRGLPRTRTTLTWVPWTTSRLARGSGYGAGVTAPGWYGHLFEVADDVVARWFVAVGAALRNRDLPVSSAHLIEATRLTEALAAVRGHRSPALDDVVDATRAVLCGGDAGLTEWVTRELVVGSGIGAVPDDVPALPIVVNLRATARRLRLKLEDARRDLDLDLRTDGGLARSHLFHRLDLLDVPWAVPRGSTVRSIGTFRESWTLRWHPELSVALAEAALHGTTVEAAATSAARAAARSADLPALTRLVETTLVADLPDALADVLARVDERAAHDGDVEQLLDAVTPVVRAFRYSDVRGTSTAHLARVAETLLVRACAGLVRAALGRDDDTAAELAHRVASADGAVTLLGHAPTADVWTRTLHTLATHDSLPGILRGRATRLLHDAGHLTAAQTGALLSVSLSVGTPTPAQAGWVEGFLAGGGLVVAHDATLLGLLDEWVATIPGERFMDVLPVLRRTFGAMPPAERRAVGDAVARLADRRGRGPERVTAAGEGDGIATTDPRVAGPLATALTLLGGAR